MARLLTLSSKILIYGNEESYSMSAPRSPFARGILRSIFAAILISAATQASADMFVGRPIVYDGDTLRIGRDRIRLGGIDAPELYQSGGREAKAYLESLIGYRPVVCMSITTDRYGRTVGACSVDGVDLGRVMVMAGHAVAYRRYSLAYVREEESARVARRGIWAGDVVMPEDARRARLGR